ncbi:MAG: winged helix-turn-helix domain-containing protein [Myxococcales bacterium]|nr:winged helix-turn-helix domain-containing protein [Myxococcales bacterium]
MHVPLVQGHADLDRNEVVLDDRTERLSPNESRLFRYLAERPGRTIHHGELLREVFGYAEGVQSRTVITTMQRLRRKVEDDPADPVHLLNVYGRGYRFEPTDAGVVVGRSRELAALARGVREGRLWLVAPGGFGKTTLVRRFVELFAEEHVWVDLTELETEEALVEAVARALGLARLEGPEAVELALRHRAPSVLVLDAAEHFGEDLVAVVQRWSSVVPVLVTSRRPCAGEPTLELGPLTPHDAARLFARRAPPQLAPDRLRSLLDGLQGVPLALELAAARLAVFSPEDLVAHLDDLGTLLTGGEGRQPSMHAVLDWSWQRTPAALRQALARLAPARQGLAVPDAVQLLGSDGLTLLARLKQWGWVQQAEGRVGLLDPVRQFVEAACDLADARRAHRQLFVGHARARREALVCGRERDFVSTEWANLRAAFDNGVADSDPLAAELAVLLKPALRSRLPTRELLRWLDHAAELAEGPLLGEVLAERADLWMARASLDAAALDLDRAEAVGIERPGLLTFRRARLQRSRGDHDGAAALLEEALAHLPGPWALHAQVELGYCRMASGQEDAAQQFLREVLVRSKIQQAPALTLTALGTLGHVYSNLDRFDEACVAYEEALEVCEAIGDDDNAAGVHTNLANLHLYAGRRDLADHHWTRTLELGRRLGHRMWIAMAEVNLAQLRLVDRDLERAESLLRSALAAFEESGAVPHTAYAALSMGRLEALRERWGDAERWWARAEPDLPRTVAWMVGVERCIALAEQGDPEAARDALEAGAEATDAGSRAGRTLAAAFCHAASLDQGTVDEHAAHRAAIRDALRTTEGVADPMIADLSRRLRDRLKNG